MDSILDYVDKISEDYEFLKIDYDDLKVKINKIMCLFCDSQIGLADNAGLFKSNDEKFGAMLFAMRQSRKAQQILLEE
jgi:hypothetical protein